MNENRNNQITLRSVAEAVVNWFQKGEDYLGMRQKVNDYLEASGANNQFSQEGLVAHRKIAASQILIYSLYGLDKNQSNRAEELLKSIAEQDAPCASRNIHR